MRKELMVSRQYYTVGEIRGLADPKDGGIPPFKTSKTTQKASTVSSDTLSVANLRLFTVRKSSTVRKMSAQSDHCHGAGRRILLFLRV